MQIQIFLNPDGTSRIETISILEDLWHDFLFFKQRGNELDQAPELAANYLLAKRYYRASILALFSYLEGVINRWLHALLPDAAWKRAERKPLPVKIATIHSLATATPSDANVAALKNLRNALVHLKPGDDLDLHNALDGATVANAEAQVVAWLSEVEGILGIKRHLDTRIESKELRDALGPSILGSEAFTGPQED